MCVMDIMNVLRTGMGMSISRIHVWVCCIDKKYKKANSFILDLYCNTYYIGGFVCLFLSRLLTFFYSVDSLLLPFLSSLYKRVLVIHTKLLVSV